MRILIDFTDGESEGPSGQYQIGVAEITDAPTHEYDGPLGIKYKTFNYDLIEGVTPFHVFMNTDLNKRLKELFTDELMAYTEYQEEWYSHALMRRLLDQFKCEAVWHICD